MAAANFQLLASIIGYSCRHHGQCSTHYFLSSTGVSKDESYLLLNLLETLGWTYWAAAMGTAAAVYRNALFRPDNAEKLATSETGKSTA
jgi:hypothetical protein